MTNDNSSYKPLFVKYFIPLFLCVLLLLCTTIFLFYRAYCQPKIAFVNNLELVYGYNGMKQAHDEYKAESDVWQSNIDTLNRRYSQRVNEYKASENKMSSAQKQESQTEILRLESDIKKYTAAIRQKAEEKDAKVTESILLQINAFTEKYAKDHGYDIVLGSQGDGNIMYGSKRYNITEDVLDELNKEYKYLPQNVDKK